MSPDALVLTYGQDCLVLPVGELRRVSSRLWTVYPSAVGFPSSSRREARLVPIAGSPLVLTLRNLLSLLTFRSDQFDLSNSVPHRSLLPIPLLFLVQFSGVLEAPSTIETEGLSDDFTPNKFWVRHLKPVTFW